MFQFNKKILLSGGTIFSTLINLLLLFGVQLIISNQLGATGFGKYSYLLALGSISTLLVGFGVTPLILKLLPEYIVEKKNSHLRGLFKYIQSVIIFMVIGIFLTGIFWADYSEICFVIAFAFSMSLININSIFARTLGSNVALLIGDRVVRPLLTVCILLIVLFTYDDFSLSLVLKLVMFGACLTAVFSIILAAIERNRVEFTVSTENYEWKKWFKISAGGLLIAVFFTAMARIDIIILGQLAPDEQIGIYAASQRIGELASLPLYALDIFFGSLFSFAYSEKKWDKISEYFSFAILATGFLSFIAVWIIFFFGEEILFILGDDFIAGKKLLLIIVIGQFFITLSGPVVIFLTATGNHKIYLQTAIFFLIVKTLSITLVYQFYNLEVMAMVSSSFAVLLAFSLNYRIRKKFVEIDFLMHLKSFLNNKGNNDV